MNQAKSFHDPQYCGGVCRWPGQERDFYQGIPQSLEFIRRMNVQGIGRRNPKIECYLTINLTLPPYTYTAAVRLTVLR